MFALKIGRTKTVINLLLLSNFSPAQAVKILIALAVFCTFGLQFYVVVEIAWNSMKDNFKQRPLLVNYVVRYVSVIYLWQIDANIHANKYTHVCTHTYH